MSGPDLTPDARAAVPIVAALARVGIVQYAEVTTTLPVAAAGPALRRSVDDWSAQTARALERVGGAGCAKAEVRPEAGDPSAPMRNDIYVDMPEADRAAVTEAVTAAVARIARDLPGCRLTAPLLVDGNAIRMSLEIAAFVHIADAQHGNLKRGRARDA